MSIRRPPLNHFYEKLSERERFLKIIKNPKKIPPCRDTFTAHFSCNGSAPAPLHREWRMSGPESGSPERLTGSRLCATHRCSSLLTPGYKAPPVSEECCVVFSRPCGERSDTWGRNTPDTGSDSPDRDPVDRLILVICPPHTKSR